MAVSATAAVERAPVGAGIHFRLLIWARWTSYRNLLRASSMQRSKLLTAILAWVLALVGGGGSALAFAGLGYSGAAKGRPQVIMIGTTAIFLLWQLAPLIFEATSPTIRFRDIARYPVAFRTFYALHLAFGLLDPSVMLGLVWLLAIWVGLLLGSLQWALLAALPFLLFAFFNLLANRFLLSLLERVLATRRGRELVLGGLMVLAVIAQIVIYGVMPRYGAAGVKALYASLSPVLAWLPPILAAPTKAATVFLMLRNSGALLLYSAAAAALLAWQLRATFSGEIYSEARRVSGAVQFRPGWSLPFLGERISAIVDKEVRYLLRDQRTWMNMAMPIVFSLIIAISQGAATKILAIGLNVRSSSPRLQVMFSAGAVLVLAYLAYDCFGFDAAGFQRWVLLPSRAREVLLGKNLAVVALWAASFAAVNMVLFASGNASLELLAPIVVGVVYGGLLTLAVGNQFSVRTPLKLQPESIKSNNMTPGMMLGNMLCLGVLVGSAWLAVALARWLGRPWITLLALTALALVSGGLYLASLNNAARYMERNADRIAAELS